MAVLNPFLSLNYPSDQALIWLKEKLAATSLRVVQTFDLHSARRGLEDCPCPHHGTEQCDCQMIVLLIYGNAAEPATLILHGNNGQTWLSITEHPDQRLSQAAVRAIRRALESQGPAGL